MLLTSYGAAREVTGSKHLAEINGHRILFDCGMFQGRRQESEHKNRELGFAANSVEAVVLSHAHIDHSGVLPMLVKLGYEGPIFATPATRDLCSIMLGDSAHIQKRDAEWLSRKKQSFVAPLYDIDDVQNTMRRFVSIPYDLPFEIVSGVKLTFHDAGHVLGSAMCKVDYRENGSPRRFLFGGDLGRRNMPILRDPWEPEDADVVLMESTYGDRDHDPIESMDAHLARIVNETQQRGGSIIIPSFALERSQEIVYSLKRLEVDGVIQGMPVFVDSPLTVNVTEVFRLHTDCFDQEIRDLILESGDPFQLKSIRYIRNVEQSKALNELDEPSIIISAAGMCEHGRILHHLKNHCIDDKNTILIVGFQAKHTLGRRIVERREEIRVFGRMYPLNAHVEVMNAFSAHAGREELLQFGGRFKDCAEKVLLVHGEESSMAALKAGLEANGQTNVSIQEPGKTVEF
jgi:metallo-beta-lactamase family protein